MRAFYCLDRRSFIYSEAIFRKFSSLITLVMVNTSARSQGIEGASSSSSLPAHVSETSQSQRRDDSSSADGVDCKEEVPDIESPKSIYLDTAASTVSPLSSRSGEKSKSNVAEKGSEESANNKTTGASQQVSHVTVHVHPPVPPPSPRWVRWIKTPWKVGVALLGAAGIICGILAIGNGPLSPCSLGDGCIERKHVGKTCKGNQYCISECCGPCTADLEGVVSICDNLEKPHTCSCVQSAMTVDLGKCPGEGKICNMCGECVSTLPPTRRPTLFPTTPFPTTVKPTKPPSPKPSVPPSPLPTPQPSELPTQLPTPKPSVHPTPAPFIPQVVVNARNEIILSLAQGTRPLTLLEEGLATAACSSNVRLVKTQQMFQNADRKPSEFAAACDVCFFAWKSEMNNDCVGYLSGQNRDWWCTKSCPGFCTGESPACREKGDCTEEITSCNSNR